MSASGLGNLVFIDRIMNHSVYLNILRDNLKLPAQNLGIENNFFYYDDDPKHTALNVRLRCLNNIFAIFSMYTTSFYKVTFRFRK